MLTALTRVFGLDNIALAEDVVQDAFCRALEIWKLRGIPENPSAWLMTTARNRAIDVLRRERTARSLAPELCQLYTSEWTLVPTVDDFFSAHAIEDDQLRMMFSCCDPQLPQEAQVALILNILCGFTAGEIAAAFLATRSAVEKRISRGKKMLAASKTLFVFEDRELSARLAAVQRALYLLFNEGYHGASPESAVRSELCREALRLAALLLDHPLTATPASSALAALMHLHAARLASRTDAKGNLSSLFDQDRSLWDTQLIAKGEALLDRSATGPALSDYHIEAAIASLHCRAQRADQTDWGAIVTLYDALMTLRPSPVIALNRAIALAQLEGPERGLAAIDAIGDRQRLAAYPFFPAALGELELRRGEQGRAREHFRAAFALARNPMERTFLQSRLHAAGASPTP
jgi:RNA polymerase sigma-70 factor (ECF subfamily)